MALSAGTRRLAFLGVLIALSVVGANIKLGPWSIALDSTPGFLAALIFGPAAGALVSAAGHLAVAVATGFPLTPVFHLFVAVTMAGVGAVGGLTAARFGRPVAAAAIVIANGVVAPALLSLLPNPMGRALFMAMVLPLTLAAAVNALLALMLATALQRSRLIS